MVISEFKEEISMSVEVPENLEEVAMRVALLKTRGRETTEKEVINQAVLDALQIFVDQELDGHYDTVKYDGAQLVIFDLMGEEISRLDPEQADFEQDFRTNADKTMLRLEDLAHQVVGSR
jgi:hypothetical protein